MQILNKYLCLVSLGNILGANIANISLVAGAAALLLSTNTAMKPADVRAKLVASVDRLSALSIRTQSGGRMNLARLVGAVR